MFLSTLFILFTIRSHDNSLCQKKLNIVLLFFHSLTSEGLKEPTHVCNFNSLINTIRMLYIQVVFIYVMEKWACKTKSGVPKHIYVLKVL